MRTSKLIASWKWTLSLCLGISLVMLIASTVGCSLFDTGEEIGRITFDSFDPQEYVLSYDASQPLNFWVDFDVDYLSGISFDSDLDISNVPDDFDIGFEIEVVQADKSNEVITCSAFDVNLKLMSKETTVNEQRHTSYRGKMTCRFESLPDDDISFVVQPYIVGEATQISKLDIVFRQ